MLDSIFEILKTMILSTILVLLLHHIYIFLKDSLTVPKVNNIIKDSSSLYSEIKNILKKGEDKNLEDKNLEDKNPEDKNPEDKNPEDKNLEDKNPEDKNNSSLQKKYNIDVNEMKNEMDQFINELQLNENIFNNK